MSIKGIPYWGENTWSDLTMIRSKDYNNILELNFPDSVRDLYDAFYFLAKQDYLYIIHDALGIWLSWCKDIRFNYRDKLVFLPYLRYETTQVKSNKKHKHFDNPNVYFNYELVLKPIIQKQLGVEDLKFIIFDYRTGEFRRVDLTKYKYITSKYSIEELYKNYLNACYYDEAWDAIDFTNKYHWIDSNKGKNVEYTVRAENKLPHRKYDKSVMSEATKRLYFYCDIRLYSLDVLINVYQIPLDVTLEYWERRFKFEAYMLLHNLQYDSFIEDEFNTRFAELMEQKSHVVYESSNFLPFYLKHYYLLNDNMPRKSYEKYVTYNQLKEGLSL
jgi:hypothetical protein